MNIKFWSAWKREKISPAEANAYYGEEDPGEDELQANQTDEQERVGEFALSREQKRKLLRTGLIAFLIAFPLLFPYRALFIDLLLRLASPVKIQYSTLNISITGTGNVEELEILLPDGTKMGAAEFHFDLSPVSLMHGALNGSLYAKEYQFKGRKATIRGRFLDIRSQLSGVLGQLKGWEGSLTVNGASMEVEQLQISGFPIPLNPEQMALQKIKLNGKFASGQVDLSGSNMESPLYTIHIKGGGTTASTLDALQWNAGACLTPANDLATKDSMLAALIQGAAGKGEGGDLCFQMTGKTSSPSFKQL